MKKYLPPEMEINLFDENEGLLCIISDKTCQEIIPGLGGDQGDFAGGLWPESIPGSDGSARDPFDPVFRQNTNTILGNDKK